MKFSMLNWQLEQTAPEFKTDTKLEIHMEFISIRRVLNVMRLVVIT